MSDDDFKDSFDEKLDAPHQTTGSTDNLYSRIKSTRVETISTAIDDVNVSEPSSPSHPQYPYNKVEQSLSGHVKEVDDTPGAERLCEFHKSGTFYEVHPDGTKVTRIYGDDFYIILQDHTLVVGGNLNITVQGNANLLVKGDLNQKIGGDYNLTVHGNMKTRVRGTEIHYTKGDLDIQTKGNIRIRSELKSEFFAKASMNFGSDGPSTTRVAGRITLYTKNRVFLDGSRVDFNMPGPDPGKLNLKDKDPTGGLDVKDSVIEPTVETLKILNSDNTNMFKLSENKTTPRDRERID